MQKKKPPVLADAFLEWYCSREFIDEVQGDLHEWFHLRAKKQGYRTARFMYLLDVVRFLRSYRVKSIDEFSQNSNNIAMLKNYLITSWRSLAKNKAFSTINILGLAVGMSSFLLISLYVNNERSYDQFHEKKSNLYRLKLSRYNDGVLSTVWAAGCSAIGSALHDNFPEVVDYVRMTPSNAVVAYEDKVFREENAYYASESFFENFTIPLIEGADSQVLVKPYTAVISESTAKKYFGNQPAVGKTLRHNGTRDFEITGVFKDVPKNSHFNMDMLFSFETFVDIVGDDVYTAWDWDGFYNYIKLEEGADPVEFESKIPDFIQKERGEQLAEQNHMIEFELQPITDIHLTSDYMMEFKPNGDGQATNFLFIIALFIIAIAWVNYINLATAKSMERSREVGIRKVMGSMRGQLIRQFLVESFLLNILALVLSVLIVFLTLPSFNQLSGRELVLDFTSLEFWLTLAILLLTGALFSGLYPAFVLSGFKPVSILKGKFINSSKGNYLRKGLVIFQFLASLVLMVGTLTVFQQLRFMRNQDLGVQIDQTLVVRGPNVTDSLYNDRLNTFKQTLTSFSEVNSITASTAVPGAQPDWNAGGIRLLEQDQTQGQQYRVIGADHDFVEAYGLEILAGRRFDKERVNDQATILMNESATRLMGFDNIEEALNRDVFFWSDTFRVVGVLKDYHQESLKKSFEPLIFRLIPNASNFYSIRIRSNDIPYLIDKIEDEWKAEFPGNPFDFFFLDDHYDRQYKAEIQFGKVFGLFAGLAIFIACLGLFGLASYMTAQRTKEIGVRKVLGATLASVLTLLSKDFVQLILISILFAIPVAWFVMSDWLSGFANQITLSWWIFAAPSILILLIALGTVTFQTVKTGLSNPVDSLRHE
ncbi:MAG: ABC transporter permease [Bacteroidota bacterium]